jgi:two-component SAPR family response regulator
MRTKIYLVEEKNKKIKTNMFVEQFWNEFL